MTKIVALIETFFLFIFSYIIPKKNNLILFGSMRGEHISGNPKIYYLYLKYIYKFDGELFFFDKNNINKNSKITTYGNNFKKYWLLLRAKYLFMDAASFDLGIRGVFIGKFNVIQMWHGEPIKKIGFLSDLYISRRNPVVLFFEKHEYKRYKYILSNPGTKDILVGAFQNKNVLNIGIPRNDLLLHQDIQDLCKNEVVEEYVKSKKKNLKKIFLFSPTFRETMDSDYFSVYELSKLNDVFQRNNILCLIKKHINEKRVFLGNNKYSNIIDVTQELPFDSTDFLPFIDTIITDYSSIYIDFLLTNKPVIWYQSDLDDYINKERGFLYDLKDVVITQSTASNFDEFINIIENMDYIAEEKEYKKSYKELREKFYGKDIEKSYACRDLTRILNLSSKI